MVQDRSSGHYTIKITQILDLLFTGLIQIDTGQILWQSKLKYNYENHILLRIKNIENVINDLPIFFKKYFEGNLELDTYKKLKKGNFYSTPLMFDYLKLYFQ